MGYKKVTGEEYRQKTIPKIYPAKSTEMLLIYQYIFHLYQSVLIHIESYLLNTTSTN